MADFDSVAAAQPQRPHLPAGWQPNLQRMLSDIVPMLSAELRHAFREFVKSLKAKRDAREIPSLSVALMEQAPRSSARTSGSSVSIDSARRPCARPPPPRATNIRSNNNRSNRRSTSTMRIKEGWRGGPRSRPTSFAVRGRRLWMLGMMSWRTAICLTRTRWSRRRENRRRAPVRL